MGFLSDSSSWESHTTKNWAISGGGSFGLGAVFFGEAKVFNFTNLDVKKTKSFLYVNGGVGAKLDASFKAGTLLDELMKSGANVKRATDATGQGVSTSSESLTVHRPFKLTDLYLAVGVGVSTGSTAGVVDATVSGLNFRARNLSSLFVLSGVQIQAALGAGINIVSYGGGVLFGAAHVSNRLSAREQQKLNDIKRYGMRPHAGKM